MVTMIFISKGDHMTEEQESTENNTPQTARSSEIYADHWTLKRIIRKYSTFGETFNYLRMFMSLTLLVGDKRVIGSVIGLYDIG